MVSCRDGSAVRVGSYAVLLGLLLVLGLSPWQPLSTLVWPGAGFDPFYDGLILWWAAQTITVGHLVFGIVAVACMVAPAMRRPAVTDG